MSKIDPRVLKQFAKTDRHHQVLDAVIELGSNNKAAKKLGCGRRTVDIMLKRLEASASKSGVAPHRDLVHQTAEGFEAKRISTAYKEDGSVGPTVGYSRARKNKYATALGCYVGRFKRRPVGV